MKFYQFIWSQRNMRWRHFYGRTTEFASAKAAQQTHDVSTTSPQRHDVASTLSRRCIHVMCPLGVFYTHWHVVPRYTITNFKSNASVCKKTYLLMCAPNEDVCEDVCAQWRCVRPTKMCAPSEGVCAHEGVIWVFVFYMKKLCIFLSKMRPVKIGLNIFHSEVSI